METIVGGEAGKDRVQEEEEEEAVCLDGSLPAYHLHRGYGAGANNWIVHLEGGGWCNNRRTCVFRKIREQEHGSSDHMDKMTPFKKPRTFTIGTESRLDTLASIITTRFCTCPKISKIDCAISVFKTACSMNPNHRPQISACNRLLSSLVDGFGNFDKVIFVYKEMVKRDLIPNVETINCLIKCLHGK